MFRRHIEWWYWLATVGLLTLALTGYADALTGAIIVTVVQVLHFAIRTGGAASFPVQIRVAYLALLLLGLWSPLSFLHWVQFVGTWALVLIDYCFLARCLSLLPWNRDAPLSWRQVVGTFFSPPVQGNILQGLPPAGPKFSPHDTARTTLDIEGSKHSQS